MDTPARPGATPGPGGAAGIAPAKPSAPIVPSFDVVRVEPNGDAVIAGQAAPNAAVELLVDGKTAARARAGADGRFTFMPPTLPPGTSEIGLRATDAQGEARRSSANVAVVIPPSRDTRPLVAVTAPDRPTVVLSQPDRPAATGSGHGVELGGQALRDAGADAAKQGRKPVEHRAPNPRERPDGSEIGGRLATGVQAGASETDGAPTNRAGATASADSRGLADEPGPAARPLDGSATPVTIVSIDARDRGQLFVTARGAAGADVRFYLNDTLIAPATVGRDGSVTFTIGRGVGPGDYRVRLDSVDPLTGKVRDRAEVAFSAPDPGRDEVVAHAANPQDRAPVANGLGVSQRRPAGEAQARDVIPAGPADPTLSSGTGSPPPSDQPGTGTSEVYVPGIETARIARGDSLWKISRRTYGEGERYTLIYDANQDQIRDPDLIYPGQVFVLPGQGDLDTVPGADRDPKRD
ncbi:LysM peptidoglycan-binding domain-containing protein [Methylobacterium radiodurans]|uniref:LysM peptidoglycan-binding domain-containing protein n=1 Tax=Methylobacterium radiodurans TaxID=2202828 RepID=UPI001FE5B7F8|nr:LysM peptidoglycan-binding domain-containing protein [Methylobacterium radiodurans]